MASESPFLIATRSEGKLRELNGILAAAGLRAVNLTQAMIAPSDVEEGIECFDTFEENALAKARYFHQLSGMPTLADDSGLCVDALGGAPGVWSKRFSGRGDLSGQDLDDANNEKLMTELADKTDLAAGYKCAAALVGDGVEGVEMGEVRGEIVRDPRGSHGFGYDPYFYATELGMTFGEASTESKEKISHRGRAFRALIEKNL
ncbi:MAG TPA: non-canonical purine NTP pyrophosphatase [Gemmatimonadaceae bacterium]|nr:non-canonical purine NTP pyrophosphatase [Gemmatimonadaceae bacterium]